MTVLIVQSQNVNPTTTDAKYCNEKYKNMILIT